MTEIAFPFGFDGTGRTGAAGESDHIRQLIEQLLFTAPGERVNRPDFGSGLLHLVFAPGGDEVAAATQFLIQSALQKWLGDRIEPHAVSVESEESTLRVVVEYTIRSTQTRQVDTFVRGAS